MSTAALGGVDLETFRREHGVRLITEAEEGGALKALPEGVYGFTFAPAADDIPLFSAKLLHSFEVHKWAGGEVRLVGYAHPDIAAALARGEGNLQMDLYPDPWKDASVPVSVPLAGIVPSKRGPTRADGNPLPLRVL